MTYASFTNWDKAERWSEGDTEKFFDALTRFGSNFSFIQTVFPNRTRRQLVRKFKAEERKNKAKVCVRMSVLVFGYLWLCLTCVRLYVDAGTWMCMCGRVRRFLPPCLHRSLRFFVRAVRFVRVTDL